MIDRDEIIRMAREAGMPPVEIASDKPVLYPVPDAIERFAALVEKHLIASGYRKCAEGQRTTQFCGQLEQAVLAEREACAMEADYEAARWAYSPEAREPCEEVAKAIRARGNT